MYIMLGSSIGQDASLSSWKDGFDSRTEYQRVNGDMAEWLIAPDCKSDL